MIFDDSFDRSLWLVIASNKKDGEKIGNVIGMLPDYVYKEIQEFISNYKLGKIDSGEFRKSYSNINEHGYYITGKIIANELLLTIDRWNYRDIRTEESYQLNLLSISKEEMDLLIFQNNRIGTFSYEIIDNIRFTDANNLASSSTYNRDYNMFRIPFGCIMSTSLGYRLFSLKGINFFKKMPDELYVVDFGSPTKIEKLVKSRKR